MCDWIFVCEHKRRRKDAENGHQRSVPSNEGCDCQPLDTIFISETAWLNSFNLKVCAKNQKTKNVFENHTTPQFNLLKVGLWSQAAGISFCSATTSFILLQWIWSLQGTGDLCFCIKSTYRYIVTTTTHHHQKHRYKYLVVLLATLIIDAL